MVSTLVSMVPQVKGHPKSSGVRPPGPATSLAGVLQAKVRSVATKLIITDTVSLRPHESKNRREVNID
jgi:hypothetical protein